MTKYNPDGKGSWAKGAKITRPPERNPNIHGEIPGFPVGSRFANRMECSEAGVHAPLRAGIHGNQNDGAFSIVLSGGYEDDEDNGDIIIYTGQGGRDTKGTRMDQMEGKKLWDGPQDADQEWTLGNKALKISCSKKTPVRVVRGHTLNNRYAPAAGYRFDGLYEVTDAWRAVGKMGFKTCRFRFQRRPGQPALPGTAPKSRTKCLKPSAISNALSGPSKPPTVKRPVFHIGNAPTEKLKLDKLSSYPSSVVKRSKPSNSATSLSLTRETKAGSSKLEMHNDVNAAASSWQPSQTQELIRRPLNNDLLPMKTEPIHPLLIPRSTPTASVRSLKRPREDSNDSSGRIHNGPQEPVAQATAACDNNSVYRKWATTAGKKKYEGLHFKKRIE